MTFKNLTQMTEFSISIYSEGKPKQEWCVRRGTYRQTMICDSLEELCSATSEFVKDQTTEHFRMASVVDSTQLMYHPEEEK